MALCCDNDEPLTVEQALNGKDAGPRVFQFLNEETASPPHLSKADWRVLRIISMCCFLHMALGNPTQQKLREFGWEVLMHPPYSPDLAPSDFHLFRSLQNSLGSVRLTSREDCQNNLSQFFDQKPQNFYSNGITSLPTRWQKVIQQNGTYIL
ncbi:hypothetical protein K1T71_005491 [Dendrolimus kikuchii]|uniref:Uncharacterized protein n=1 Tax=Dendrolimus kikuchii TaxID=765133 RepID=A0ACC1D4G9_9NEOP|nr:hypothetical protein K1T71_005491 [Dendrolimus kikuchii]